ncbi:MAG TPA: putative toxin-antitoxin system toxin component, PIN family [Bryobacteraceae bacterium]
MLPNTGILVRMNVKSKGPARRLLEPILSQDHELVLSEFLLEETARVLSYPRLLQLYNPTQNEIVEHVALLRARADIVSPIVYEPVVLADPNDDPVVYTAIAGRCDILCALDRHFYIPQVLSFCSGRGIRIMDDVALLEILKRRDRP